MLNTDRTQSMSAVGNIPWTAINAYASRYGIEGEDFDRFEYLLSRMDTAYLKLMKRRRTPNSGTVGK